MMSSLLASPRPLRRLLSAVLALSVLLTTLGSGHSACAASDAHHGAAAVADSHLGMAMAQDEAPSGADASQHAPRSCPDHDRHGGRGAAGCAVMAHCAVGVLASAVVVPASQMRRLAPTVELTASRPLETSYQPDSPPPKA